MRQTLRRRDGAIRRRRSRRLFAPVYSRVVSRRRRRHQRRDGVRSAGVEVRERVRGRDGRNAASRDEPRRADATVRVRGIARRRGRRAGAVRRDSSGGDARRSRSVRAQTRRTTRIQGDGEVVARRARIRGAVRGVGVFPPLETPGGNVLTLPPTAIRESVAGSVFLRNPSDDATETFEIIAPRDARDALVVSPHVGTLGPGETKRVRVAFCPKTHETRRDGDSKSDEAKSDGDGVDAAAGDGADASAGDGADASDSGSSAPAPPRADTWRLTVHVAPRSRTGDSPNADPSFEPGGAPRRMHLEVRTTTHGSAVSVENLPETSGSSALAYARWISATWRSARARRVP